MTSKRIIFAIWLGIVALSSSPYVAAEMSSQTQATARKAMSCMESSDHECSYFSWKKVLSSGELNATQTKAIEIALVTTSSLYLDSIIETSSPDTVISICEYGLELAEGTDMESSVTAYSLLLRQGLAYHEKGYISELETVLNRISKAESMSNNWQGEETDQVISAALQWGVEVKAVLKGKKNTMSVLRPLK